MEGRKYTRQELEEDGWQEKGSYSDLLIFGKDDKRILWDEKIHEVKLEYKFRLSRQ